MTPFTPVAPYIPMPPAKALPRRMGIRLGGCEAPLEDLIKQHSALLPIDHVYTLLEVGSAGCVTLRAFSDILSDARGDKWRTIGLDLSLDKAWSVDMNEVYQSFVGLREQIVAANHIDCMVGDLRGMNLFLMDDPRTFVRDKLIYAPDFTFIDGSHGISCGRDFLAVEHKVPVGGLVVFHDFGLLEQGTDWQEVDREFISVRSYVHRLGLNTPSPKGTLRKGWRWVCEVKGSRHWNGDGNSAAVVQRTNEPLEYQPELNIE